MTCCAQANGAALQQIFVHRAGHCAFTPAETVTAVQTLENRLSAGGWPGPGPAALNAQAAALGPQLNIFPGNGTITPAAPASMKPVGSPMTSSGSAAQGTADSHAVDHRVG